LNPYREREQGGKRQRGRGQGRGARELSGKGTENMSPTRYVAIPNHIQELSKESSKLEPMTLEYTTSPNQII